MVCKVEVMASCVCVKAKAFMMDYLSKLGEVKDTVHKHSLLHHLTHMILDQFPDASDFYSDIGAISRCAKVGAVCPPQRLNWVGSYNLCQGRCVGLNS